MTECPWPLKCHWTWGEAWQSGRRNRNRVVLTNCHQLLFFHKFYCPYDHVNTLHRPLSGPWKITVQVMDFELCQTLERAWVFQKPLNNASIRKTNKEQKKTEKKRNCNPVLRSGKQACYLKGRRNKWDSRKVHKVSASVKIRWRVCACKTLWLNCT